MIFALYIDIYTIVLFLIGSNILKTFTNVV